MWDPMATFNAIQGDSLFSFSERGKVSLSEDGVTTFTEDPDGNERYQLPGDSAWNSAMLQTIREQTLMH